MGGATKKTAGTLAKANRSADSISGDVSPTPTLMAMKVSPQTTATLMASRMSLTLIATGTAAGLSARDRSLNAIRPKLATSAGRSQRPLFCPLIALADQPARERSRMTAGPTAVHVPVFVFAAASASARRFSTIRTAMTAPS